MSQNRVAMVTLVTSRDWKATGVLHSVRGQARAATTAGLPIDYLFVNGEQTGLDGSLQLERYRRSFLGPRSDRWLKQRRLRSVQRLASYDAVLLRYPTGMDLDPTALFRSARTRVATVHHTKELEELSSTGAFTRWAFERINGPRILSRVSGIVGVTDEIRSYELARIRRAPPSAVVANGIDVSATPLTGFTRFDGTSLRLVLIASDQSPWHGLDRVINSLSKYRGAVSVSIDVAGEQGKPAGTVERHGSLTARYHGTLRGSELDALCAAANLAVGTMALHRKGLRQACALKTREFVARGLPMVYAYDDVDLPKDLPFALRLSSTEDLVDPEAIIEFASQVSSRADVTREMRAFAARELDWSKKVAQLVRFAESL